MLKVVVSCDAVLNRDYYLEIIEAVLELVGDNTELYTLVHSQGAVIGPIEQRKIHSSYLSHKVKTWQDLYDNEFQIPAAAERLFIPCSVDLIINISRGLSQGIKKCDHTKMITFLVEDYSENFKAGIKRKIFSKLITDFKFKSLKNSDVLFVSESFSKKDSIQKDYINFTIPVKLLDFKPLPDALFQRDYFLINTTGLSEESALSLIEKFKDQKFKFIGDDSHLAKIRFNHEAYFFGEKCSGELAPLMNGAKFLLDFDSESLPVNRLRMLSCARPVFGVKNKFLSFGEAHAELELEKFSLSAFQSLGYDKEKARGQALAFEELKFKHLLKREMQKFFESCDSHGGDDCCGA